MVSKRSGVTLYEIHIELWNKIQCGSSRNKNFNYVLRYESKEKAQLIFKLLKLIFFILNKCDKRTFYSIIVDNKKYAFSIHMMVI